MRLLRTLNLFAVTTHSYTEYIGINSAIYTRIFPVTNYNLHCHVAHIKENSSHAQNTIENAPLFIFRHRWFFARLSSLMVLSLINPERTASTSNYGHTCSVPFSSVLFGMDVFLGV